MLDHFRIHCCLSWRGLPLGLLLLSTAPMPAQDTPPDARGFGVARIENEVKLSVPEGQTEAVWNDLRRRYADPSFLDDAGHRFIATFGDEQFVDVYFDTPDLQLLYRQCGVRHRSRVVTSGSATAKDGRQLLQIKWNRNDQAGLERTEIKFTVEPASRLRREGDLHPMLGLVKRDQRAACYRTLVDAGVDPNPMRPIVTIKQKRRRVYLSDQQGAFATITLDMVTSEAWYQQVSFTEVELELNEIRYTEADAQGRARMNAIIAAVEADLLSRFQNIHRDQTPKYNKVFAALESGAPLLLPMRSLIGLGVSSSTLEGSGLCLALMLLFLLSVRTWKRSGRKQRMENAQGSTTPVGRWSTS